MSEDGGPSEGRWSGRVRDDPELARGMEDDGAGFEAGGSDRPAAAEPFDGVVVRAAALELDGEVQIAERGGWDGLELGALFIEGGLPGGVRAEAGGAAAVGRIVPGDLLGEQGVGRLEINNGGGAQQRDEAVLESAEAALDLALGLRASSSASRAKLSGRQCGRNPRANSAACCGQAAA